MTAHFTLYELTNQVTQHADGAAGWLLLKDRDPERHPKLCYANKCTKPSLPQKCFKITERKKLYLARTSEIFIHNVLLFSSWSDITNNVIITELIQCTVVI